MLLHMRRQIDRLVVFLPIVLMGVLAMATYWLVRNTPILGPDAQEAPPRHEPDYFMRDFSVKVFGEDGRLKSEMLGTEGRHFPDTDTLEIDQPRIRILGADGRVTTAMASRALVNADGSEAQLFDKAVVVREPTTQANGEHVPRSEVRSDFLHLFANTEQIRSHLPVVLVRGEGDQFVSQEGMNYNHLDRVMQLSGRVRGTLMPPKDNKAKK